MTSTLPYEVKPLGMLFFLSDAEKRAMRIGRERSLGDLGKTFPDRVLATLLEHVDDAKTLMNFSLASKMCFQFASFDSLWKKLSGHWNGCPPAKKVRSSSSNDPPI